MNHRLVLIACLGLSTACGDALRENTGGDPEHGEPDVPALTPSPEPTPAKDGADRRAFSSGPETVNERAIDRGEDALPDAVPCSADAPQVYAPGNASPGTYTVPVAPALAHAATTVVDKVVFHVDSTGRYRLDYTLPRVLAGCAKYVHLQGSANDQGQLVLYGKAGTATCERSADGMMTCHEHLTGVVVDLGQVRYAVEELGMVGADRAAYLAVARHFSIDPLGVLTFRDPR